MDWLRLDSGYPRHRKTHLLKEALGNPLADAYPPRLMAWLALVESEKGILPSAALIEDEARWTGKPGVLVKALLKAEIIEASGEGFVLVGWEERNGAEIRRAKADRERKRASRSGGYSTGLSNGHSAGHSSGNSTEVPAHGRTDGRTDSSTPPTPLPGGLMLRPREQRKAAQEAARKSEERLRDARMDWETEKRRVVRETWASRKAEPTEAEILAAIGARP